MAFWQRKKRQPEYNDPGDLGPLETEVMSVVWSRGRSNVRDVVQGLTRPLAYTTVMTTLDRLFKKGLLRRVKIERAFLYTPVFSHEEWQQRRAGLWFSGFLSRQGSSGELLLSCLVDAVGQHDEALLDELERQIALKRREFETRGTE